MFHSEETAKLRARKSKKRAAACCELQRQGAGLRPDPPAPSQHAQSRRTHGPRGWGSGTEVGRRQAPGLAWIDVGLAKGLQLAGLLTRNRAPHRMELLRSMLPKGEASTSCATTGACQPFVWHLDSCDSILSVAMFQVQSSIHISVGLLFYCSLSRIGLIGVGTCCFQFCRDAPASQICICEHEQHKIRGCADFEGPSIRR